MMEVWGQEVFLWDLTEQEAVFRDDDDTIQLGLPTRAWVAHGRPMCMILWRSASGMLVEIEPQERRSGE